MSANDAPAAWPAPWSGVVTAPTPVQPSGLVGVLIRAVIAVLLVLGWVQTLSQPVERDLTELYAALDAGTVTAMTIERPREVWSEGEGTFAIEWTGSSRLGRTATSSYSYVVLGDSGETDMDEAQIVASLARQSSRPVDITWHAGPLPARDPGWSLLALGAVGAFLALVLGPTPRLATRWAWFWLGAVPPAWLAFVLLEPVPLWRRAPAEARARKLTGGWAFLIGLLLPGVLAAFVPGYRELF